MFLLLAGAGSKDETAESNDKNGFHFWPRKICAQDKDSVS